MVFNKGFVQPCTNVKKVKNEVDFVEGRVSAKKVIDEMNKTVSSSEDDDANIVDNDEIEYQGNGDPHTISDKPVSLVLLNTFKSTYILKLATVPANMEDYPVEEDEQNEEKCAENAEVESVGAKDVRSTEDRTVFVKNLPFDVTIDQIKALFINATEIRVLKKNNGQGRGKAFIEMKSVENAESVCVTILLNILQNCRFRQQITKIGHFVVEN